MTDPTPLLSSVLDRSGDVEASAGTFIVEGRHEGGRSTLADSTWNLCNIILGAGLFALPRVFAALGLLGGVFMTVLVAVLSYKTIALMLRASEASGEWTYGSVLERLWGHKVARGVHVAVIVGCAGFVTLYIIVTCDVSQPLSPYARKHAPRSRHTSSPSSYSTS